MKEILCVILLIAAVLVLYEGIVGGEDGMQNKVRSGGGRVRDAIVRLNP
ncbi:hypothetical protein [Gorillibacterium sp. sgz5001074]